MNRVYQIAEMLTHLRPEHLVNDETRSIIDEKAPEVTLDDAWYKFLFDAFE